jgi:hypothetical protein
VAPPETDRPATPSDSIPATATKLMTCPHCKQTLRVDALDRVCYFCHNPIEPPAPTPPARGI